MLKAELTQWLVARPLYSFRCLAAGLLMGWTLVGCQTGGEMNSGTSEGNGFSNSGGGGGGDQRGSQKSDQEGVGLVDSDDSSDGSTANGDSSKGNAKDEEDTCAEDIHEAQRLPANLLFVVDRSGSMSCNLPPLQTSETCIASPVDPNAPTKWQSTRSALESALEALQNQGDVRVGISMFPRDTEGFKCDVAALPNVSIDDLSSSHVQGISDYFKTVTLKGDTPLAGATILGYQHLHKGFLGTGRKFLVLITDGFETCAQDTDYPERLESEFVPNALLAGIQTFVIGVPGSEAGRATLSNIAYEGGTARNPQCNHSSPDPTSGDCHFDLTSSSTDLASDLEGALAEIRDSLIGCELEFPEASNSSVDVSKVVVRINGESITEDTSAPCNDGADGWQYNSKGDGIVLCGPACEEASQSKATVVIALGCPPPA